LAADPEQTQIAQAVQEVSEKASLLVREEIELAKAEITEKVTKLAKGAGIGAAAGVFVLGALVMILHGIAWMLWFYIFPDNKFFWGFFMEAGILLVLAAIAGYAASRLFKGSAPPTPDLAIEEAQRIRTTVTSKHPETTV
jgi:Putative Actinobacterial Holin-X, holin superfamily III